MRGVAAASRAAPRQAYKPGRCEASQARSNFRAEERPALEVSGMGRSICTARLGFVGKTPESASNE